MLKFFRSGLSKYFATGLFAILILSFVLWGGAGDIFNRSTNQIAIIGERTVSPTDYVRAFNNRMTLLNNQYGGDGITKEIAIQSGLGDMIERDLISSESLNEVASLLGLRVTDQQLLIYIKGITGFKDQFDNLDGFRFEQVARSRGMSKKQLENVLREEMTRLELITSLTDGIKTPKAFQTLFFRLGKEKRSANIIKIDIANVADIPAATDDDLKKYYDDHSNDYLAPEYRTFNFIRLTSDDFISKAKITDEEVSDLYNERISEYTKEEKRSIKVMMFDNLDDATKAHAELLSGGAFDAVNLKFTETTAEDSLVEDQLKNDTDEIYGEDSTDFIFNGSLNQNSEVINTDFGFRIFNISQITPGEVTPLSDVSITLEIELKRSKASTILYEITNQIETEIADGSSVEEIATALELSIGKITATTQFGLNKSGRSIPTLPAISGFLENAFNVMPGDDPEIYESDDEQFYLISMLNIEDEKIRSFEDVKDAVSSAFIYEARDNKAIKMSDQITTALTSGEKVEDVIAKYPSLKFEKITAVRGQNPDSIDKNIHSSIFTQKVGGAQTVQTIAKTSHVVIHVISAESSTETPDAQTSTALAQALDNKYKSQTLAIYQKYLNDKLPVRVNKAVIDQVLKQILDKEE